MNQPTIDTLRISVTDHCNLNCVYCKPENIVDTVGARHAVPLQWSDFLKIASEFIKHGITRFKITGGEPFCREGLVDFIKDLKKLPISDISITTNGTLAEPYLQDLYDAGLKRITFSLDALSQPLYEKISGKDMLDNVWSAINKAIEIGYHPIKINAIIIRGLNEKEATKLARLTISKKLNLRFIELMAHSELDEEWEKKHISSHELKKTIENEFGALIQAKRSNDGYHVRVFMIKDALGNIGFISPNSKRFCEDCTKLRLTSLGIAKTCLRSGEELDLKPGLKDDRLLNKLIFQIVQMKKEQMMRIYNKEELPKTICHPMATVGG